MIRFRCPECGSAMEVDESFAGRPARCPTCGAGLKVPTEAEASASRPSATPPAGTARVQVGGEEMDVVPPLETMVLVSMGCAALSVVVFVVIGLLRAFTPPWAVGALLGMLLALLGVIIGVPAYHSIRRSKGRRRGRTHAMISMLVGTGLFLVFLVVALVGFAQEWKRPPCKENLNKIHDALRAYTRDHEGAFPPTLDILADDGYLQRRYLTCPAYKVPVGEKTYVLTPDINLDAKRPDGKPWWPPDTMIVSDGPPYTAHEDGKVRALLLGGEVKHVPYEEWSAYQNAQTRRWNRILNQIRAANNKTGPGDSETDP